MVKNNKKGFTLIELIVTVAILSILASIAVPFTLSYLNRAEETSNSLTGNSIASSVSNYLSEFQKDKLNTSDVDPITEVDQKNRERRLYVLNKLNRDYNNLNFIVTNQMQNGIVSEAMPIRLSDNNLKAMEITDNSNSDPIFAYSNKSFYQNKEVVVVYLAVDNSVFMVAKYTNLVRPDTVDGYQKERFVFS